MKKLATCAVAITGFIGTSAFAADMGVPAAPPPVPVWNWTGWYAGVNAGASMGTVKTNFNANPVTVTTNVPGLGTFNVPTGFASQTESPDGFIGGGQIGYNWQFSPIWVVGIEADFQGALEKDHITLTNPFSLSGSPSPNVAVVNGTTVLDYSTKIDWFGTARLRAGYVWGNGNVFTYVTGGLAYGKVDVEGTSTVSGTITNLTTPPSLAFATAHAIGHSDTNTGWVLGYGTEGRLGNSNWTWKIENLYMDLGHLNDTDVATTVTCHSDDHPEPCTAHATGGQTITNTHFTDWILRGGLNYKFY